MRGLQDVDFQIIFTIGIVAVVIYMMAKCWGML